jgi:hypothetical protein
MIEECHSRTFAAKADALALQQSHLPICHICQDFLLKGLQLVKNFSPLFFAQRKFLLLQESGDADKIFTGDIPIFFNHDFIFPFPQIADFKDA